MSRQNYYSGRVQKVVYSNESSAYYVMRMVLDSENNTLGMLSSKASAPVSVVGHVPGLKVENGTWFGFEGKWVNDPRYGKQLSISRAPVLKDSWDADSASAMLVANGVGMAVMAQVRGHFGDDDLIEALASPDKLEEVPGLAKFSALHVAARWKAVVAQFKTLDFLSELGIPSGLVKNIWKHFGDDAHEVLSQNPWALVEVDGIKFQHGDEAARKLGLVDEPKQVRGAVLSVVKNSRGFGHLYMQTGAVFHGVRSLVPDTEKKAIVQALAGLHKDGLVVIDRKTKPGVTAIYEPWCYQMEKDSAELLIERNTAAALLPGEEATDYYLRGLAQVGPLTEKASKTGRKKGRLERTAKVAIDEWGSQTKLQLSGDQKKGILHALTAPVSVLAGLPGTGKTTGLRAAVRILQDAGVPFLLCAPTGIAAKNLSARTGAVASTIHRAFSAKGIIDNSRERNYVGVTGDSRSVGVGSSDGDWGYSPDNPHPADVVIIDEASMVDQHLLFRLLHCTKRTARLVFVGDYAQLPSVGPGNVLRDLLNSGCFPSVKLDKIFRQDDTSGIVYAAHSMHKGEVPETDKDFALLRLQKEDDVLEAILKVAQRFYDERYNFQVLSPKHSGAVGVTTLNERLRALLNPAGPGKAEMKVGQRTLREGDRIMVIRNKYAKNKNDKDIFNGDVGKITKVDRQRKLVGVTIFGEPPLLIWLPFKEVGQLLSLAYATTVHKSQGLEYDRIVMPLVTGFYHQLQRNLLYTAVTRAREKVLLIGHHEALVKAVHNSKEDDRMTLFLERLTGGIPAQPSA